MNMHKNARLTFACRLELVMGVLERDLTLCADAQTWLDRNFSAPNPVEEMVRRSGVPERGFKRRFTHATGVSPLDYVQRLRIEYAKRRLEQSDANIDEISWAVGYEDPAFSRRLFRRVTGVALGAYRRRYRVPGPLPRAGFAGPRRAFATREQGAA